MQISILLLVSTMIAGFVVGLFYFALKKVRFHSGGHTNVPIPIHHTMPGLLSASEARRVAEHISKSFRNAQPLYSQECPAKLYHPKESTMYINMPPRKHAWIGTPPTVRTMQDDAEVRGYNKALEDVAKRNPTMIDPLDELRQTYGLQTISVETIFRDHHEPYSGHRQVVHKEPIGRTVTVATSSIGGFTIRIRADQEPIACARVVLKALKEVNDESPF